MNRPYSTGSSSPSSGSLQRPSLIAGLSSQMAAATTSKMLLPWSVSDAALRPVPPLYPPLNPGNTAFASDAAPSVVAARISECLRKRSISTEYDDEAHTAACMTVDRVHFTIHLFRGSRGTSTASVPSDAEEMLRSKPDFSHGVIVEVMRTRGDTVSFHSHCRAILAAALGLADGQDTRVPIQTSPYEFKRFQSAEDDPNPKKKARLTSTGSGSSTTTPLQSLENCMALLRKDRICAQQLGMQSLVALTDHLTSGLEGAMFASLAVLGSPAGEGLDDVAKWITSLVQNRVTPGEEDDVVSPPVDSTQVAFADTTLDEAMDTTTGQESSVPGSAAVLVDDPYHGGVLRSLALRALSNAVLLVAQHHPQLFRSILSAGSGHLVSDEMLSTLVDDLAGATRPPGVVAGTRLASAHEATLATICIRVLAQHSEVAMTYLDNTKGVLDALERARSAGKASHDFLARESEKCYLLLSQDIRTC